MFHSLKLQTVLHLIVQKLILAPECGLKRSGIDNARVWAPV